MTTSTLPGSRTATAPATAPAVAPAFRAARDVALLLARTGLGVLMIGHAVLEFRFGGNSLGGVGDLFARGGVPVPALAGPANVLLESVGGVAMILGLGVPAVGVLMALNMVGAWMFVHTSLLYSMDHNGPETVIAIGLLSLTLAAAGSGRLGLDEVLRRRFARRG
jgi:putative oxidoreductase